MAFALQIAKIIFGKDFQRTDAVIFRAVSYLYKPTWDLSNGDTENRLMYIWFHRQFSLTSQQHPFHSVVRVFITGHTVHDSIILQLVHLVVYQEQQLEATPLQCSICQRWREMGERMTFGCRGERLWGELAVSDVLPALFWLCVKELSCPWRKFLPSDPFSRLVC